MTRDPGACLDLLVTARTSVVPRDPWAPQPDEEARFPSAMPTLPQGRRRAAAAEPVPSRGYAATPWGPAPVGRAMARRSPFRSGVLWPVLTLGVAGVVWFARVHREMAAFDRRRDVPVLGPVLALVLLGWTVVVPMAVLAAAARRVAATQRSAGLAPTCRPRTAALLCPLLGLGALYLQRELNRAVDVHRARPGARVALRS